MVEEPLNGHRRLRYSVRGPEWAFVIPYGDLTALEEVMRRCSTFWNGAGSLILPIKRSGWNPRSVEPLLQVRSVDLTWVHSSVDRSLHDRIRETVGEMAVLHENFDRYETHVHRLATPEQDTTLRLTVPAGGTAASRILKLALWGHLNDEDLPYWRDRFEISDAQPGAASWKALIDGQISGPLTSPLLMTASGMNLIWSNTTADYPYLWVFEPRPSFSSIVNFWNLRARIMASSAGAPVLGVPHQALGSATALASLPEWLPRRPGHRSTPDCFVSCTRKQVDLVERSLAAAPIVPETAQEYSFQFGNDIVPNSPPTYALRPSELWGKFQRGLVNTQLITIVDGRTSLVLPAPDRFHVRDLSHVRLTMHDLPLPMPVTARIAASVYQNAVSGDDGVRITTAAMSEWNLDLTLPRAGRALKDWASDRGYDATATREAMDAEAILRRLGSLTRLDALASDERIQLLEQLEPPQSRKLAQRLVAELNAKGEPVSDAAINEQLASMALFLELHGRTASELAGLLETRKTKVLQLLPDLVAGGFVRRAREVSCPECRYKTLLDLADQAEVVPCQACAATFPLPMVDASGTKEPETVYRLDGLMARVMSQDILPVLLALRAFGALSPASESFAAWPGLLFERHTDRRQTETDLVVSFGGTVFCCEVKKTARTLKEEQFSELLELCAELQARPALAALNGEFPKRMVNEILVRGGRVIGREALLSDAPDLAPPLPRSGRFVGLVTQSGTWRS